MPMALQIQRGDFDPQRGRYRYFVCFTRSGVDDDEVRARLPVELALSVSETGEVADLSFQLPKACQKPDARAQALALLNQEPAAQTVDSRVFISVPGRSGDAVLNSSAELQMDAAGRIVAIQIHPF
jgi:hypothetical protein